jgi:hypothetical protein
MQVTRKFYHATDKKTAENIVNKSRRISTSFGEVVDFGSGFYLTNDVDQARDWAEKWGGYIITFDVDVNDLRPFSGLHFEIPDEEWMAGEEMRTEYHDWLQRTKGWEEIRKEEEDDSDNENQQDIGEHTYKDYDYWRQVCRAGRDQDEHSLIKFRAKYDYFEGPMVGDTGKIENPCGHQFVVFSSSLAGVIGDSPKSYKKV